MVDCRVRIIACAVVIEEMLPLLRRGISCQAMVSGLHINPVKLKQALQDAITASACEADVQVLGYGLCAQAVIGLQAADCPLIIPRVDDCIALFLGSREAYNRQHRAEPGTYYLTRGWIETGIHVFNEYDRMLARYGSQKTEQLMQLMLRNYTRLAFIDTGQDRIEKYRIYSRSIAGKFGLRYEELQGSDTLMHKMLYGPWDDDFIIIPPGAVLTYQHYFPLERNRVVQ